MKVIYLANVGMPTEKANGIQITKTCEALADLGHDVELIVTDRYAGIKDDPFTYYGIKRNFSIRRLPVWDIVKYGRIGFLLESFLFARAVRRYLADAAFDVVYGRDERVLMWLQVPYVWESHTGAWNSAAQTVARKAWRVVVISKGLKEFYTAKGVPEDHLIVAHDGIDLEQFARPQSKKDARTRLGLPAEKRIAMYIGRLDGWKGTETLLAAAKHLPRDTILAVIGGERAQVARLSKEYPDVTFLGFRPYTELPDNMAAADVLVLPNTGKDMISVSFTSPLKLFAYMTSGIPIVASDLPSIREVVDEQSAYLVAPDDAGALGLGIEEALAGGSEKAEEARQRVAEYSWCHRAEHITASLSPERP